jgi:hypothetical protein
MNGSERSLTEESSVLEFCVSTFSFRLDGVKQYVGKNKSGRPDNFEQILSGHER